MISRMTRIMAGTAVPYAFGKTVDLRFDAAIEKMASALVREGFSIVSDIDVSRRLKAKAGVELPRYRILAACHPSIASRAMLVEPEVGAIFPCSLVFREESPGGPTRLDFADPRALLGLGLNEDLRTIGEDLRTRMEAALNAM